TMIITRLKGGMGNQMFQYAFGKSMATALQTDFQLDLTSLLDRSKKDFVHRNYDLDIFELTPNFNFNPSVLKWLYRLKSSSITRMVKKYVEGGQQYIKEGHFHVVQSLIEQPQDRAFYDGWWQSETYFRTVAPEIRKAFRFKTPVLEAARPLLEKIEQHNSICLNVRRTDFLKVDTLNTTNLAYFERGAQYLAERITEPHFFIFSDDIEWCQKNIQLPHPIQVVGHEIKGRKFGNYLQLMKACKHYIIPNSSFAWWAIWLNERPEKIVVAPKNWFNDPDINTTDLVPSNWVRL
ncbi:MAG: alpha-1,2-fucosyltransferase, partial [Bacteroidota bacterium]